MKALFLVMLCGIATSLYAQPAVSSTRFTPISEKIKKLPSASSLAKMKPSTSFILGVNKLSDSNNWLLHIRKPMLVRPQEVEFGIHGPTGENTLIVFYPANSAGVYVFELNVRLATSIPTFKFNVKSNETTQAITINSNQSAYQKLVFAVTLPNNGSFITITTQSGSWGFVNLEITPMK